LQEGKERDYNIVADIKLLIIFDNGCGTINESFA